MKNKTPRICPHLKIYMGLFLFYWATWKCFMVNLHDTRGGGLGWGNHFWGGVWPLDSSNTSPVSLLSGKTAQVSLISVSSELSMASISEVQGMTDCSNGVHVTCVECCAATFLRRHGWILMYKCMERVKIWYDCKHNAVLLTSDGHNPDGGVLFIRMFHSGVVLLVVFWVWRGL